MRSVAASLQWEEKGCNTRSRVRAGLSYVLFAKALASPVFQTLRTHPPARCGSGDKPLAQGVTDEQAVNHSEQRLRLAILLRSNFTLLNLATKERSDERRMSIRSRTFQSEDGDVVFLAERLRGLSHFVS